MKKFVGAALAALMIVGGSAIATAKEWTKVRIATEGAYAPFNYVTPDGELAGFDVDIAKALCAEMKVECTIVKQDWDGMIPALLARKFDAIVASMSITPARKERVDFTEPYLEVGQMVIIRDADFLKLRDPAAMDRPSSRVGFVSRTTGDQWARANLKKAKLLGYANTEEGVDALHKNQIDFFIQDAPAVWRVTGGFMNENKDLRGLYKPLTKEELAWVVPKDNPELLKQLNAVLEKWKKDGTLDDVLDDWITVRKTAIEVKPAH